MKLTLILSILFYSSLQIAVIKACIRKPQGASGDSSAVDDSFRITIEGNPATYIPGQTYNVTLSCDVAFKFISFTIIVEAEENALYGADMTGHFELIDTAETRFSKLCENMVESTNTNIKQRIDVSWVAPTNPNSTCVYIKAAVLQHRNVWFMDDGFLTKRICPEEVDDINSQTRIVNPCCACDEAKYELVVERRWMRNTHPKDFPADDRRSGFSELIGASHSYDYRFWEYGNKASIGLKETAEFGSTKTLENEIKEHTETGKIRTIIKAPGIQFRKNIMGNTLATVRVDPRHHLVSFVTKIKPSPDWILGVAGLELCLANCTWIESKVLNLLPWDVGTDAGPSYESPDQQQVPADVVRRITSTFPSDYRSPFYDETGAPMKPMATLYMTRKKLYERECVPDGDVPFECITHPWVDWTECSTKCGAGTQYRTRAYKDPGLAERFNCEMVLRQTRQCVGTKCGLQEEDANEDQQTAECELTPWSSWGPCSKSCGRGFAKRTRDYKKIYARDNCQAGYPVPLEDTQECLGNACGGAINGNYENENDIFDEYSREPTLLEEENINNDYPRRTQDSRQKKPNRINENWNVEEHYPNRQSNFGGIDQNGYGNTENDQQETNYGYGNNNNKFNYLDQNYPNTNDDNSNNYANNNDNNFGYSNNNENKFKTKERWISNNLAKNRATYDSSMDGNFNQANINTNYGMENVNNFDKFPNNQDPYNNFDRNVMGPMVYNQQYTTERMTTNRFKSPGFYGAKTTRYPSTANVDANLREVYDEYGNKVLMAAGTPPDQYTIVQDYCNEKPYVILKNCPGKKVISNYWFFDADDRQCKLFTTDNCDENKNKFRSLEACEGVCLLPQINLEKQQTQNNRWNNQFQSQSQIRPTKAYERRNQNNNQRNQWQRNRNYNG